MEGITVSHDKSLKFLRGGIQQQILKSIWSEKKVHRGELET